MKPNAIFYFGGSVMRAASYDVCMHIIDTLAAQDFMHFAGCFPLPLEGESFIAGANDDTNGLDMDYEKSEYVCVKLCVYACHAGGCMHGCALHDTVHTYMAAILTCLPFERFPVDAGRS